MGSVPVHHHAHSKFLHVPQLLMHPFLPAVFCPVAWYYQEKPGSVLTSSPQILMDINEIPSQSFFLQAKHTQPSAFHRIVELFRLGKKPVRSSSPASKLFLLSCSNPLIIFFCPLLDPLQELHVSLVLRSPELLPVLL